MVKSGGNYLNMAGNLLCLFAFKPFFSFEIYSYVTASRQLYFKLIWLVQ